MADTDNDGKPRTSGPAGEGGTERRPSATRPSDPSAPAEPAEPTEPAKPSAPTPGASPEKSDEPGKNDESAASGESTTSDNGTGSTGSTSGHGPGPDRSGQDPGEQNPGNKDKNDKQEEQQETPGSSEKPGGPEEPEASAERPEKSPEQPGRPAEQAEQPAGQPDQSAGQSGGLGESGEPGKKGPQASPGAGQAPPAVPPKRPAPPGGGILMGKPFGVPVYVAPSWFLVAALITWVFGGQLDRVLPDVGAARYLIALFFAVAFYASVLVHELAHTVAALRFKLPVRRIQLQFFGGVSEIEKETETPGREFVLAFVGPLFSLALAGVFYAGMHAVEPRTVPGVLLAGLMISNLLVAVFNLLPGLPLDGGRMLRAVVWKISGKPMTGTVAAAWVGRALAIAVLVGLPLATRAGGVARGGVSGMDALTDALLAAILAAIIWTGAGNSLRMARLRERLPELRARTLTRRAVPVETDTPLSEALRRANEAGARALVVVDGRGDPLSLVRESAIAGIPQHRRPWVAVSTLAQDLKEGMRVPAELAGEDLLEYLRATPATEYLVVEETGEIYGVLSTTDVERAFVAAMAKPSSA